MPTPNTTPARRARPATRAPEPEPEPVIYPEDPIYPEPVLEADAEPDPVPASDRHLRNITADDLRRIADAGVGQDLAAVIEQDVAAALVDGPENYVVQEYPDAVNRIAGALNLPQGVIMGEDVRFLPLDVNGQPLPAATPDYAAMSQRVAEESLEQCENTLVRARAQRDQLNNRIRDLVAQREVLNTQVGTWRRYVRRQLQESASRRTANP